MQSLKARLQAREASAPAPATAKAPPEADAPPPPPAATVVAARVRPWLSALDGEDRAVGCAAVSATGVRLNPAAKGKGFRLHASIAGDASDDDFYNKVCAPAVEAAAGVIRNGWVEAYSCDKAVSIVKLMGRDAGFVAAHAALASNLVDLCLVPEVSVSMEDVFAHVDTVLAHKGHMVIVVAEGAGQEHVATGKKDASGHTIYGDIGTFLRDTLNKYLKPKGGRTFYIDPSYIIRSVPPTPLDHVYCVRLANNAVHTSMRGYTGVCVGAIHNVIVILKSKLIASGKKQLKPKSSTWQTCVQLCKMPPILTGIKPKLEKKISLDRPGTAGEAGQ